MSKEQKSGLRLSKTIYQWKWGNNPTQDEHTSARAYIIPNFYNKSLATFAMLAAEAKKDFPHLKDDDIECGVVTKSSYNQGMPLVTFSVPPDTNKTGYHKGGERQDFYHT
jgi:hypothetical protein